jgi:hypothetical protein
MAERERRGQFQTQYVGTNGEGADQITPALSEAQTIALLALEDDLRANEAAA